MKANCSAALILVIALGAALPSTATEPVQDRTHGNADAITAQQIKDYLSFIASDEMEGRFTPSRGLDTTAKFLSMNLSRWSLAPAGDPGSYFQHIALRCQTVDPATTYAEIGGKRFSYGKHLLAKPIAGRASGPLAYAGSGWVIKPKVDPYKNLDVKDKLVLIIDTPLPNDVSPEEVVGTEGADWERPANALAKRGAKGIIIIPNFQVLANWDQILQEGLSKGDQVVERFASQAKGKIPTVWASPGMLNTLLEGEEPGAAALVRKAMSGDECPPFLLNSHKILTLNVGTVSSEVGTQNVVATLRGSDPALREEYVVIGAHYDHLGVDPTLKGDSVYNGADDNGSGTAAVLAMAEAFSKGPRPRRSILFIWHCGEERGLWGSMYFTQYPTIPLRQVVVELNIDMIGRTRAPADANPSNRLLAGPGEVYLVGSAKLSNELHDISEAVNRSYLNLAFNYRFDDPDDKHRFFYRSDHFSYAQKGIPIIFYMDGEHEDWHEPSDTADKIDYQNMQKIVKTIYATAWELANRANRPRVDRRLGEAAKEN